MTTYPRYFIIRINGEDNFLMLKNDKDFGVWIEKGKDGEESKLVNLDYLLKRPPRLVKEIPIEEFVLMW